ncbi:nonribosomal peptide synthase [Penicillium cf. griseofulvum]|nr:nonribosomal peptide synthase [Penicillium cf. griseofulvum]
METRRSIFPGLNGCTAARIHFNVIRLPLGEELAAQWRRSDNPRWAHAFKVSWALLLSRYIDSQNIAFGVIEETIPQFTTLCLHAASSIVAQIESWEILEDPDTHLAEVAQRLEAKPWPEKQLDGGAIFDTGIGFQSRSHQNDIHEQLACQKQPNTEAICAWDYSITYGKLDQLSRLLQIQLISLGVRSESVVPLCFEKSMWTVVAAVGVLRAGGTFVLLEPSQPAARLSEICTAVQAKVIVTSESLYQRTKTLVQSVVRLPDGISAGCVPQTNAFITPSVNPTNAAYIAFTSGSTGKPKGIVIEHQSFCANALAQNQAQNINRHTRAFQFASYGFDSSILEMLMTLIAGGCVCVPSDSQRIDELARAINDLRANWLELTPSVARILTPEAVPNVKSLVLVGEPLSKDTIAQWTGKVQLINAYGPAECSVVTTIQPNVQASDPSNIGRSYSGHCWIVNPRVHGQLQPIGATGELVISGPLVGRGYLNQPDQQAYIQRPPWALTFKLPPEERFYRTGDIAYYNIEDGTLRYVGRKDRQVKLHGQRIELQEVEHHVQQYKRDIIAAADIVNMAGSQSGDILALFVTYGVQAISPSQEEHDLLALVDEGSRVLWKELQQWLGERLPSFMVPTKFILMNRFPITATGKLDRKTLVALAAQSPVLDQSGPNPPTPTPDEINGHARPYDKTEDIFQSLFSEVLGIAKSLVGVHDRFFALGGTSLRAIELVVCARARNIAITATDVISLQTPSELARSAARCETPQIIQPFGLIREERQLFFARSQYQTKGEEIEDIYPCTPLQAGMMSLSIKIPGSLAGTFVFSLQDGVDTDRFKIAWEQVVSANPILRTQIIKHENELFQVIIAQQVQWADSDHIASWPAMALSGPLLRNALIDRRHQGQPPLFVVKMHHSIFDAWSYNQILEEVETVYKDGLLSPRPSFNQVINYISNINLNDAHAFWAQEFANCKAPAFPARTTGRPSASRLLRCRSRHVPLRKNDQDWALANKAKLAWALVVSAQTNTDDVVFGLTISGRTAPINGIDRITGPTIATIPCRVQMQPDQSLQETVLQLHDHEIALVPFEHTGLACIGNSSPEAAAACGFQNLLTIRLCPVQRESTVLMAMPENEDEERNFNTYPLSVVVQLRADSFQIKAFFDGSVLSSHRIEMILEHFESVLEQVLRHPQTRVGDFMSHFCLDRNKLMSWNQKDIPRQNCVHTTIQDLCTRQSESEAVCAWDGSLKYHELSALAHSVASQLQAQGSGPETVIGICMERSKWFPVAMLGVLMSGAAMVLLEPSFPVQRLQSICKDVNAHIILSSAKLRAKSAEVVDNIITLTADNVGDFNPSTYQRVSVNPQNAAYVAFTSGSTGLPKGVIIEHGMLYLAFRSHRDIWSLSSASRGLIFSSPAFDISILEVIFVLAAGGCVCMPSETQRMNNVAGAITNMGVNWAVLTPTVARTLTPSDVPSLKTLVLGGESMSEAAVTTWAPLVELHNGYGPAECSMVTTSARVTMKCDPANIGYSPYSSCWIVDSEDHHKLLPVGSIGELLIGGPLVGRGYANRPSETSEAFIRSPAWVVDFPFIQKDRFYKTGDLAFYNPDGSLSIVGRKDSQVKFHGMRIELHEIEHCAEAYHRGTTAVAAMVNLKHLDESRIALFTYMDSVLDSVVTRKSLCQTPSCLFVPTSNRDLAHIKGLKEHMSQALPLFMVPSLVIPLLYLPLSPTGKVDRKKLRERAEELSRSQLKEYLGSSTPMRQPTSVEEIFVRRCFAAALQVEEDTVGVDDNFFTLGGDSIAAMRLLSMCQKRNMILTMLDFLSYNTVSLFCENAQLATASTENLSQMSECRPAPWSGLYTLLNLESIDAIEDIHSCSDAHSGILERYTSQFWGSLMFGIKSTDIFSPDQVISAWNQLVQRHTVLRTVILHYPGIKQQYIHVILKTVSPAVLVLLPSENIVRDMRALNPLSWDISPPHRLIIGQDLAGRVLVKLETGRALIDAISVSILLEEFGLALRGRLSHASGPPHRHYLSYIASQSHATTLEYWKEALSGVQPCILPRKQSPELDPLPSTPKPRSQRRLLTKEFDRLNLFWQSHQLTLTNIFQLAWALVLRHYIDSEDVCFGTISSGRNIPLPHIWQMLGSYFNILPCRITLGSPFTVLDILRENQNSIQHRNEHQHCSIPEAIRLTGLDIRGEQQLFNTVLTVQPDFGSLSSGDIGFDVVHFDDATEYDMCVAVLLAPEHIEVELRYWTSTCPDAHATEVLDRFFRAVAGVLDHAREPLVAIAL